MGRATKYLLPNPKVMGFAMRVMANLTDGKDGDAQDQLFYLLRTDGQGRMTGMT